MQLPIGDLNTPLGCTWRKISTAITEVDRRLETVHPSDAARIISLFERLTLKNPGGHTIFGAKPLTTIGLEHEKRSRLASFVTREEWTAWTSSLEDTGFISTRFILRESTADNLVGSHRELLLYNRDKISAAYEKHKVRFISKLGPDFSLEHLLHSVDSTHSMESLCGGDFELKGILLGYGQRSAQIYGRVQYLGKQLGLSCPGDVDELRSFVPHNHAEQSTATELESLLSKLSYAAPPEEMQEHQNLVGCRLSADDEEGAVFHAQYRAHRVLMRELHDMNLLAKVALARWINLV